jgi:phosphoribosylamine--glycine ligase
MKKVFVTGTWGRPNGLEANIYRSTNGDALVRRYPDFDEYDVWKNAHTTADHDPFGDGEKRDWAKYYGHIDSMIKSGKWDAIICCFLDDAITGGMSKYAEKIPTLCVNREAARLEDDRWFARSVTSKYGVAASAMELVRTKQEALAFLSNDCPWEGCVVKLLDSTTHEVVAEIYDTKKEAISAIESRPDAWFPSVIEEKLSGHEVAFSVLVSHETDQIIPMVTDFEYTRLATGDLGRETSEMGSHDIAGVSDRVLQEIFWPMMPWFKEVGYTGWLDASCMYNPKTDTLTVFEFMTRLGSSQFELAMTLLGTDFSEIVQRMHRKALRPDDVRWRYKHGVGVVVCDSYAMTGESDRRHIVSGPVKELIYGRVFADYGFQTLSRMNCVFDKQERMVTRGDRVYNAIGAGDTFPIAKKHAYSVARFCKFTGAYYRTDIGYRWEDDEAKGALGESGVLPRGWYRE